MLKKVYYGVVMLPAEAETSYEEHTREMHISACPMRFAETEKGNAKVR
jgi:hypothetical protein